MGLCSARGVWVFLAVVISVDRSREDSPPIHRLQVDPTTSVLWSRAVRALETGRLCTSQKGKRAKEIWRFAGVPGPNGIHK